jgi:hypothetical protein
METNAMKFWYVPLLLLTLSGCGVGAGPVQDETPPAPVVSTLEPGTPIPLILLRPLNAGMPEGSEVPFMVAEDVRDDEGRVLVAKGSPAIGIVTWSRSEGALGRLVQRPARLEVDLRRTHSVDEKPVALSPRKGKAERLALNQENTRPDEHAEQIGEMLRQQEQRETLEAVARLFEEGKAPSLETEEGRRQLALIAERLGLSGTSKVLAAGDLRKAQSLLEQIRRGAAIKNLAATGGSLGAFDAIMELASLAGEVRGQLGRMFRGRTIQAPVGLRIDAYVLEPVEVTVSDGTPEPPGEKRAAPSR